MATLKIRSNKLKSTSWQVGQIVEDRRPFFKPYQYLIVDCKDGLVTLEQITEEKRVKPELLATTII